MLTTMGFVAVAMVLGSWISAAVALANTHSPLTHILLPVICPNTHSSAVAEIVRNGRAHVNGCDAEPWLRNGTCGELCLCNAETLARGNALCDAAEDSFDVPVSVLG